MSSVTISLRGVRSPASTDGSRALASLGCDCRPCEVERGGRWSRSFTGDRPRKESGESGLRPWKVARGGEVSRVTSLRGDGGRSRIRVYIGAKSSREVGGERLSSGTSRDPERDTAIRSSANGGKRCRGAVLHRRKVTLPEVGGDLTEMEVGMERISAEEGLAAGRRRRSRS